MTSCLGLTQEEALARLRAKGITPRVVVVRSPKREAEGTARVVRVSPDGSEIAVAYFPDRAVTGNE